MTAQEGLHVSTPDTQNESACVRSGSWSGRDRSFGEAPVLTTPCEDRAALVIELRPWSAMEASRSQDQAHLVCRESAALPGDRPTRSSDRYVPDSQRFHLTWFSKRGPPAHMRLAKHSTLKDEVQKMRCTRRRSARAEAAGKIDHETVVQGVAKSIGFDSRVDDLHEDKDDLDAGAGDQVTMFEYPDSK